jgi:hypothetical protein
MSHGPNHTTSAASVYAVAQRVRATGVIRTGWQWQPGLTIEGAVSDLGDGTGSYTDPITGDLRTVRPGDWIIEGATGSKVFLSAADFAVLFTVQP